MKPRFKTYYWTTDAASGHIEARSPRDVLDRLIAENEWPEIGSPRERRLLDDGAWLTVTDDGEHVIERGLMP
jgi:hypothetical protein